MKVKVTFYFLQVGITVGLVIKTEIETQISKIETHRDQRIYKLSRPNNLVVVETETHRNWMKVVETETLKRLFKKI